MAARRNRQFLNASLIGCCLAALAAGAGPAFAQDATPAATTDSDAIVVTAQRRAERSVDVPISITTVNSEQLEAAGATQLSDISRVTPALRFDSQATLVQPTIRGVGTAVTTSGGGSNVGIYIDGFYSPNPATADLQLMNVESVQVLKGPQGTLFGRNTTGGAILVTTAEPSVDTHAELRASLARFNTQRYQFYGTTGITDNLAVDLEGFYTTGDGFTHNIFTGSNDDGAFENWSGRVGVKWDISNDTSLLLRYSRSRTDDPTFMNTNLYHDSEIGLGTDPAFGSVYATSPNEVATNEHVSSITEIDTYQATFRANLGFADFTSSTQYRTEDTTLLEDLDHTSGRRPLYLEFHVEDETFSQEFLFTSRGDGPLQWTAGLFYLNAEDLWPTWFTGDGVFTPGTRTQLGGSGTTTRTYAAFADFTYAINPQLFLTVGARYSRDEVVDSFYNSTWFEEVFFGGRPRYTRVEADDLKDDTITPRIVLRYEPTPNSSIYASYSQGNKAGIIDVGGGSTNHVEPEDITAYEIGYKYDSGGLAFDIASFYYDYSNLQVSLFKGTASAQIINAASSEIYGLEGQVRYDVTDNLTVNAGLAWTHAEYTRFEDAPVYTRCALAPPAYACSAGQAFAVVPTDLAGVDMQRTPEWTGNLGLRYNADVGGGEMVLSGNLYYTSDFFFGPSGTQFKQDAYSVTNLRGEWTDPSEHYSFAIFGNNVFDERYRTQVQYNQSGIGSVWNSPAVWGVEVGLHY